MINRLLFIKNGCPHCSKVKSVVPDINIKLSPEKRIRIINITAEDYNANMHPVAKLVNFENTPFLYLDGICVEGMTSEYYAKDYITKHLKMKGEL